MKIAFHGLNSYLDRANMHEDSTDFLCTKFIQVSVSQSLQMVSLKLIWFQYTVWVCHIKCSILIEWTIYLVAKTVAFLWEGGGVVRGRTCLLVLRLGNFRPKNKNQSRQFWILFLPHGITMKCQWKRLRRLKAISIHLYCEQGLGLTSGDIFDTHLSNSHIRQQSPPPTRQGRIDHVVTNGKYHKQIASCDAWKSKNFDSDRIHEFKYDWCDANTLLLSSAFSSMHTQCTWCTTASPFLFRFDIQIQATLVVFVVFVLIWFWFDQFISHTNSIWIGTAPAHPLTPPPHIHNTRHSVDFIVIANY